MLAPNIVAGRVRQIETVARGRPIGGGAQGSPDSAASHLVHSGYQDPWTIGVTICHSSRLKSAVWNSAPPRLMLTQAASQPAWP